MSYILDALRKADAQRERDPARGIHARPVPLPSAERPARRAGWPWVGGVAALAVVVAVAWFAWRAPLSEPAARQPARATSLEPAAPAGAASSAEVAQVAQAAPAVQPPPAPPAAAAPAAPVAPAAPAVPAVRAAPAMPATPAAVPVAPGERVVPQAELPPDVQRELPKLSINGGVHSQNASQRMLIVGGQVFGEGAEVAPGVVLDQVQPKAAVLRFRGHRFSVSY